MTKKKEKKCSPKKKEAKGPRKLLFPNSKAAYVSHPGGEKKKRRKAHACCCFLIQRLLTFHTQEGRKKKTLSCDTTLLPVELLSCYQCVVKFSPSAFCTISNRPLSQSLAGAYDNDNLNPVLYHLTPCTQSPDWLIPSHSCPWETPECTPWYDQKKKCSRKKKKEAKGPRKLLFPN